MGVRFVVRSRAGEKVPGELAFSFEQARVVIGRGVAADVRLPHATVSEHHATVQARGDHFVLLDTGSTNGTKLDGQRVTGDAPRRLRDGALIEFGVYVVSFHSGVLVTDAVGAERTAELARRLVRDAAGAHGNRIAPARLCVVSGAGTGAMLELPAPPARMLVGSASTCQLVLVDPEVAPEHLELVVDLEGVLARTIDGRQGSVSRRLRDGDEIVLGATHLLFEEPAQASLDALRGAPDVPLPVFIAPEKTEVLAPVLPPPAAPVATSAREPGRLDADLMIYALAAVVVVASALGLVFLLRTP